MDHISRLAARAATILTQWAGLSPLAKCATSNPEPGDITLVVAMCYAKAPEAPADLEEQITVYLEKRLREARYHYLSFKSDYSPQYDLAKLVDDLELQCTWPMKAMLMITLNGNRGFISDAQGYVAGETVYELCEEGWLITQGYHVPSQLRDLVIKALAAGSTVATFEPFAT